MPVVVQKSSPRESPRESSSRDIIDAKALQRVSRIVLSVIRSSNIPLELFEEAYGEVLLALTRLLKRFDPTRNNNFWAYAQHRIEGTILDVARKNDPLSRTARRKMKLGNPLICPVPKLVELREGLDVADDTPEVEILLLRRQMHAAIGCDGILTSRERRILERHFRGDTFESIGDDFGLTGARIYQIINVKIVPKLRAAIERGEVRM